MKVAGHVVTVGADPEVFIVDRKKNAFISAHSIIPGTKKKPHILDTAGSGYFTPGLACQADGTALEINIPPAARASDFLFFLGTALGTTAQTYLGKHQGICATPVARYDKDYFNKLPASALELGCDPDYDAWNEGKANPRPTSLPNPYARTGAGHVAVGWRSGDNLVKDVFEPNHFNDCIMMAQMMDLIHDVLGPLHEVKDDEYRRGLYGKRGAFRPKPFGVEYRTPSNSWLRSIDAATNMYYMAITAFALLHEGHDPADPTTKSTVQALIKRALTNQTVNIGATYVTFRPCSSMVPTTIVGYVGMYYDKKLRAHDFVPAPEVK